MMSNINSRLLELRKALDLTRAAFGDPVGVSDSVIQNIEYEKTEPKPLLIQQICKIYHVNREWLETGEGDMFAPMSADEELARLFGSLFGPDVDPRIRRSTYTIINALKNIPPEAIPLIRDFAQQIADDLAEKSEKREE